jgi:hypothetical protein
MISRLSRPAALCALSGLLTLAAGIARADVTVQNTIAVEGAGAMAMGNLTGTTRTTISGDKSRTDSDIQMKSRLVRMLAHNAVGPSATIVRLGDDKIYRLNINKKEYTETTFEQMREQMSRMNDQMNKSDRKEEQTPSAVDESKCEWLPPKVQVNKSGEKTQIAGYEAERMTLVASQPCKDKETGAICEITLALDEWLASGFTESAEAQKFHKAYAQKIGFDVASSQDFSQRAQAMFGRYKGLWSEIVSKMQGMKGYPVKSSFTLALGGEQCKGAQQAKSDSNEDSSAAGGGNLANQVAGKLGSLFHKKKDEQDAPPAQTATASPPPVPAGDVVMMTITSQLVSVTTDAASSDAFVVPADFKKRELKTQ